MSSEGPVTALQEEIRRAGARADRLHARTAMLGMAVMVLAALVAFGLGGIPALEGAGAIGLVGLGVGFVLVVNGRRAAALYREMKRDAFYARLLRLSPAERAAILLPLRSEGSDGTRAMVERLVRGLKLPTELAPAEPRPGAEPAPAEPPTAPREG